MTRPGPRQRGYGSAWDKARAGFLRSHPWCAWCAAEGKQIKAEHVHHSTPHRGDQRVFWDKSRWLPLCAAHHNRDAQQIETQGYRDAVKADGLPLDPDHPFYTDT
jgi:5-methylcytosine-specific restriction protein A